MTNVHQAVEVYTRGTKAWFSDDKEGWVSATCLSNTISGKKVRLVFEDDNNAKEHVFESSIEEIEKTGGQSLPPLRNPPKMENTDDLTNLSYLNEPAVLNTIRTRYIQHLIYTYSGIVLIAMNPFDRVALYDPDIVQHYSGRRRGELEPHLFAIAEDAYRCMVREQSNQTIVVSGESGAGKTVSAKYIMRYFATADDADATGRTKKTDGGMTEVEEQILATNPIMEAFGNAKTTRNDNSSRFGKYIEIQFDEGSNIIGAKIRTYLLERSRLIFQPETERNYHIFYQLCAGAPLSEKREFELGDFNTFHYLNQSGTGTIAGVDDAAEFDVTQRSLSTVGLSVQLQWQIFRILAALLHIGNIHITGRGDAMLDEKDKALAVATRLLGINPAEFRKWIVRKQIVTRSERIVTNLSPVQAHVVKDSVAKYVYANLFEWLVCVINTSLSCPDQSEVANFIGVLDIYGFEHFKKNSFEQFCINYANEKLQQQFNQHVFKLEQEEYMREKINWTFIEFSDNQKCIDLIEGKLGILSLLDEESRLPSGSDDGFVQKLYSNFDNDSNKNYFKKPRFSNKAFTIAHYALDVQYEAENFIDKNKDTVADEHLSLLQSSEFDFLKEVLEKAAASRPTPVPESKRMSMMARKPTLGSIFKQSLINLMDTIGDTNVHYIRCIKPNEGKIAWEFEPNMVLAQLRACGVLETIRISCAGYPSRWTFEEFTERYYALVPSVHWDSKNRPDVRELCNVILSATIKDTDKYQIGSTKIFFRAGQLAYLEKLRSDRFNACAVVLQKYTRRFVYRTRYVRMRDLAVGLQRIARRKAAQLELRSLRKQKAATLIQTQWRRYAARKEYVAKQQHVLVIQTAIRSFLAKREYQRRREQKAALQIQRHVRGWFARKRFQAQKQFVIQLQSFARCRMGRKELVGLRVEARSANHYKEVSYALENKVVELTQAITSLRGDKVKATERGDHLEIQIRNWTEKYTKLEKKTEGLQEELNKPSVPQADYDALIAERDALKKQVHDHGHQFKIKDQEISQLNTDLNALKEENEQLKKSVDDAARKLEHSADESEVAELKSQIVALKQQLAQVLHVPRQPSTSDHRGLSPGRTPGMSRSPERSRALSADDSEVADLKQQIVMLKQQLTQANVIRQPSVDRHSSTTTRMRESALSPERSPRLSPIPFNRRVRRNSSAEVLQSRPKTSIDNIRQAELLTKNPRPTSIDQFSNILGADNVTDSNLSPDEQIHSILQQEDALQEEILEGLIKTLKMPLPSLQNPSSRKEILFPAHIINMCVTAMWRRGYYQGSERLLFALMDMIQKQCLSFIGDDAVVPDAFWLTNVHELLSLIIRAEGDLSDVIHRSSGRGSTAWNDFEKLVSTVKYELQCLEDNIFHAWMKELKKQLSKMIVPALLEGQSLPGFITTDSHRFFNRILTGSSQPVYSMDDLLNFLNKVWRTIKCYYIEPSVSTQVLTELFKLVGVTAFNDLLMRRNFSSWKRAMQIQYNITRIEEWCKSHDTPEGALPLEPLMQATKLLQFKKATVEDIEIIYEMCWILTPTQIQKLISQYQVADYENPIKQEIVKEVASRVLSGNKNDILLLDSVALDNTTNPFELPAFRDVTSERYLPAWLKLKHLRRLIILVPEEDAQATPTVA